MNLLKSIFKRLCGDKRQCTSDDCKPEPDLVDYEVVTDLNARECIICLESFECGDHATLIRCGHMYHTTCLYRWFVKKKTCPICDINVEL